MLYFYIHLENLKINEFNFDNFIKIRMPTKDYSNLIPKIKYKLVEQSKKGGKRKISDV